MDVRVIDKAVKRGVVASRGISRLIINIVGYTHVSGSPTWRKSEDVEELI
jgi:hypothetical protein